MSIQTRVESLNDINNFLPDNTNREINEQDVRDRLINLNDSSFSVMDGLGYSQYDNGTTYPVDDFVFLNSVIYKKINTAEAGVTPPNAASWEIVGSSIFASETQLGLSKIATIAEVNAKTNDTNYVTPLKMSQYVASEVADLPLLRTLTGTASGSTDLGTFTQAVIPDSSTIKSALQSIEDELAIDENRIPYGDAGSAGLATSANLQYDGSNLSLGLDPTTMDASATNNYGVSIGTPSTTVPLDTTVFYVKNYQDADTKARPFYLTEDGDEIDLRSGGQDVFKFTNETNIDTADIHLVAGVGFFEESFTTSNSIDSSTLTFDVALQPAVAGDEIVFENKATIGGVDPATSVNAWISVNVSGDRFSDDAFFIRPIYDFRAGDENKKGIILLRYNYF